MTNYLGSAGAQQFSITIASGSTTGTATISAVGSGAFIIYGGINPSVAFASNEAFAYLMLTNSTTITATRNTSTAGTVVVKGCIIDGDTTNLIKSVQSGTITISSSAGSGTATISSVTNNNAVAHFLGSSSAASGFVAENDLARISLSGTTVTATRGSGPFLSAITVSYEIIEFQGTALNQAVQNVSASSSSNVTSWTSTITSVTTNNAIIIYGGATTNTSSINSANTLLYGSLTNGTTVTVNVNTASTNARTWNGTVVEFISGLLNSNVQRSTTTLTGVTSNTSTISNVTAGDSGINFLGNSANDTNFGFNTDFGAVALTNGTTVTTTKNTATNNITSSWEVFEFSTGGGVTILPINNLGGWFGI